MKRKIYDKLLEWKSKSNGSTALLIDGARRVPRHQLVKRTVWKWHAYPTTLQYYT